MNVTPANIALPHAPDRSDAAYRLMSARAVILEMMRSMKQLYDTYVISQSRLEQTATVLQQNSFKQAIQAKDLRREAEYIAGALGIVGGAVGLAVGIGGGVIGRRNDLGFAMGLDAGSHLGSPANSLATNAGQMGAAFRRGQAEEHQIHSDLSRSVSESTERDASKAQDNAAQHRQQYLQDASQLAQESVAVVKASVAPR
ncbi:hypothetical protein J5T34_22230 [Cupriavidus gilardii]|uniref:hypothetical protein n=1 Tax=Cupriavidus gilardii TaxID=82541 RepID=UPI001ABEE2C3|nr:hypothetical protein [Cupriavidus gilardii]MBO4123454.1 hypothetical protein [Cupriavidus gilardii]